MIAETSMGTMENRESNSDDVAELIVQARRTEEELNATTSQVQIKLLRSRLKRIQSMIDELKSLGMIKESDISSQIESVEEIRGRLR